MPALACLSLSLACSTFVTAGELQGEQTTASQAAPATQPAAPVSAAPVSAAPAPAAPAPAVTPADPASGGVSLDRIRAGLQRETFLAGERGEEAVPTFRTEVTGHVITLRNYWLNRDPDTEPDPFMYPIPSAPELLITYGILKPRAALRARKHRALKRQIQEEVAQVERQRAAAASAPQSAPEAASPPARTQPAPAQPASPTPAPATSSSPPVAPATPPQNRPPNAASPPL